MNIKNLSIAISCGAVLMISACAEPLGTAEAPSQLTNPPMVTRHGDQFKVPVSIPSFSDFILIETQLGQIPPRRVTLDDVINDLAEYDVVFVGEAHGHAANHFVQSKIFAGLHAKYNNIALSMEQFNRPKQSVIDQYLAGEIGEETLIHEANAWEHYRSSYRPLVEFAKRNNLSVIASEVPPNMVSCVGERGPEFLNQLTGEPRGWIADQLHLDAGPYKDKFYSFMDAAAGHRVEGDLSEAEKQQKKFYRFAAQVSRDDTMAMSINQHLQANPQSKVMHINGSFHSAGMLGTIERLLYRNPSLRVANIHPILVDDPNNPAFEANDVTEGQYLLLLYPLPKRFVKMSNINAFIARTKDKIDQTRCAY